MRMKTRVVSTALAASVVAVMVGAAPAGAATNGMGTTSTKTSVLTLQLGQNGSLLNLGLLTDTGGANTDAHGGTPQAAAALVPITLQVPALHLDLSTPPIATLSPGGKSDANSAALTLAQLGVPATLATATIKPAALHSEFLTGAAKSTMTAAEVDNLTLIGGALAKIDLLASNLGATALTANAAGARGVNIGNISVLDLGALLKGIGAELATLPLGAVSDLLKQLGIPVTGLTSGDLATTVKALSDTLTGLRATLVGATTTITNTVDSATGTLLKTLNLSIPSAGTAVTDVNALIGQVQSTLTGLVSDALTKLDSFPLLTISGAQFGIITKAADTVGNSAAAVGLSPLVVTVAGIKLPPIDLQSTVDTVNGILAQGNNLLGSLLSTLGLPTKLLDLSLLKKVTNVSQNGSYTTATAGLNVLDLKIAGLDPTVVLGAISKLTGPVVGSLLTSLPVLGSSASMGALGTLLGQAAPLLNGAQLQIASLASASTYTFATPVAAPGTPGPQPTPTSLPHTGGDPELAILGVLVAVAGLAAFRWRRLSRLQMVPARVPSDS